MVNRNHREFLIENLKRMEFESLLEIGCGRGEHLTNIESAFPKKRLVGIDIDKNKIESAKVCLKNTQLFVKDLLELPFEDKSFDIVLSSAVLFYITPENIRKALSEMIRVGKNQLIFFEFYSPIEMKIARENYYARDYEALLRSFGVENVWKVKIPTEMWPALPWKDWGYYIEANL